MGVGYGLILEEVHTKNTEEEKITKEERRGGFVR
jgi:hypothetical protein